ncbi:MAG: hypothetical protein RBR08_12400 [Desulforegulaceae bacterium]|nr:hypothetical protein [Desulforegulaceae bacterium]
MDEIDNDLIFSSLIKINYDKRFIRTAQNFIENLSRLAGADKKEISQVTLLIEECLAFIIDKYLDSRMAAHIEILFKVTSDKKICVDITDIGPPIHESMIPLFDVLDKTSEAGLWYKVVQGLSDRFVFVNKLGSGWLIQFEKYLDNLVFVAGTKDGMEKSPARKNKASGEKHIRPATVDDIPALIDLAYMTYRYSYVFPDFYDRDLLEKYISQKIYDIMVTECDLKVIGAYAIKYMDEDHLCGEVGAAMIAPEYRSGDAIGLIVGGVEAYIRNNPYHCDFFVASAVTSHVRSQKSLAKVGYGFKPFMIFLNMVSKPEFIGIEHQSGGREAGLYVYHLNQEVKIGTLYITDGKHRDIIDELLAYTGKNPCILAEFLEPENLQSQVAVARTDIAGFTTIVFEAVGQDWFSVLTKTVLTEIASGIESIKLAIPASAPLPFNMEKKLNDLNFVFCGLSMRSLDKIDLAYCMTIRPVDFSLIKLYDPVAQKLLMYIERDYCACVQRAKT